MLRIFNELACFFEDNYERIHVRDYAKLVGLSPPTASKRLEFYAKLKLLKKETDKGYHLFFANKENDLFVKLQGVYYSEKLEKLAKYLENELLDPIIVLFGSLCKSEATKNSDIDLAIFVSSKKKIDLVKFEKKYGRKIQTFIFKNKKEVEKQPELFNNILNGIKIRGSW